MAQDLIELAQAVLHKAYAPYSGFHVGAAIRSASGQTYAGCNVENASYGLAICAERSALAAKALQDMGMTNVAHIDGGWAAWVQADAPIETLEQNKARHKAGAA